MKINLERWNEEGLTDRVKQIARWVIAFFMIGFYFVSPRLGIPFAILGASIMVLGVLLIAPDIAGWISPMLGSFLWSTRPPVRKPVYSAAEAHTINGRFAEAEQEYEQILSDFPDEIRPHIELIVIAIAELGDLERAEKHYQRGLQMLKNPAVREELTQVYQHYLKNAGRYVRIPARPPDTSGKPHQ
jgi:tetratricopeptide (TPR) repeat protein